VEPAPKARLPFTVRVPIELPGDSVPPPWICVVPTVPVPPSVPPALTMVRTDAEFEPFTPSAPAFTVVLPV
jgi:hypothetical protein